MVKTKLTDCPYRLIPRAERKKLKIRSPNGTARKPANKEDKECRYWTGEAIEYLADIGVPTGPDGTPLGIGWDD